MRDLFKNKKIIIAVVVIALAVVGIGVGAFLGKNSVKINPEKLEGLIDTKYTVSIADEQDNKVSLNFVGDLNDEAVENLTKKVYEIGENWNKNNIEFNVFKTEVQDTDKFYNSDVISKVSIDYEKKRADLGSFLEVPAVEKAKKLENYNKGNITSKEDKTVVVSMDMDLKDKNPTEVVAQAKAFIVLFKDTNNGKVGAVELHLNGNGDSNVYNFNSEYDNILETVRVLTF